MQYGYFDTQNREYVITRPDTPAPWANYLGSTEYGAIISGNAGGYSFAGSGANGRILRYRFNSFDQPGRYIYLRDQESGDFWSVSWMPVRKPLERFCSVCRHGMGYTVITGDYAEIHAETAYYVPVHGRHEVWRLTVRNDSARPRHLMAAGFAELTSEPNYEQDLVNLQYSQFITGTELLGHGVRQVINGNMIPGNTVDGKVPSARLFAMEGAEISGWCGDRDAFLGPCRDYSAPIAIETGRLGNVGNYGGNSCGAIAAELTLAPGEERTLVFLLGLEQDYGSMEALCAPYENPAGRCKEELAALRSLWEARLSGLQVRTPSPEFNEMVNTWNAYQCYITFLWSRAASFQYCGMRNGYGYRDTVQDIQGILHLDPALGRERLVFMLSAQMHHGAGLPLVKYSHTPGAEDGPESDAYVRETGHPSYRADDALWLFPTVYKYVCETGDTAFLRQAVPFADRGSGTVFEHLRRALDFSRTHLGIHGLPAGLWADWNDCLRLGEDGASVFVAMQLYGALGIQACFAGLLGEDGYAGELQAARAALGDTIQSLCWDQDRFIRGFTEDGAVIGGRQDPEASLWLNPQSWSVISGLATDAQAETALELVESQLMTGFGAALMDPPYHACGYDGALMQLYNPSLKENGGIFSQSQGWLMLAEALAGHGNRAFSLFRATCPAAMNDRAEIRRMEPYCHGQFTEGRLSPHFGRSHVHWLTGTASTVMVGCVEGILGLRPEPLGMRICPSVPSGWSHLELRKRFRGKWLEIRIENPDGRESGCACLTLNGVLCPDGLIRETDLKEENTVIVRL